MRLLSPYLVAPPSHMACSSDDTAAHPVLHDSVVSPPSQPCVVVRDSWAGVCPATNLMQQPANILFADASSDATDVVAPARVTKSAEIVLTPLGHVAVAAVS